MNFSRYQDLDEVKNFLSENKYEIQCIVAKPELNLDAVNFGDAQHPKLNTYADNIDTMKFLEMV
ncbi:hypothetical protein BPO_0485 [Bergeyella porcorum]|uniref:Uncharacterized protein n=1 Tax=Bergeyella porcorum TaxID=1735111 RepID=A0AAU0F094_9FLAO